MTARLPSGVLVSALLRRVNDAGGIGMVRARGDESGGAILLLLESPGEPPRLVERRWDIDGKAQLVAAGPSDGDAGALESYWRRRRGSDSDLWVIELTIADAERFAAETILAD